MVVALGSGIDDRNLDVYAIRPQRRRDLIGVVRHLRSGEFVKSEGVDHLRTRSIQLEPEPELPINVNGELVASTPQAFLVASTPSTQSSRKPPPLPIATSFRTASKSLQPSSKMVQTLNVDRFIAAKSGYNVGVVTVP
ncbi:MAG: hypothetical protein JOZ19_08690 [Rubrobacter sp.]|nr:hypothetical protein [Rubrobacter sp.]